MLNWIVYLAAGKLAIFFFQSFPLPEKLEAHWFIGKLHRCDMCSGFYIFSILALLMQIDLLSDLGFWYIPVASEIITGMSASFFVHLLSLGWKEKFSSTIVI